MTPDTVAAASRKRKQPPSFQHLPAERAKKLKRDWVEKKKIKSKWRHEKRKEGLGHTSQPPVQEHDPSSTSLPDAQDTDVVESDVDSDSELITDSKDPLTPHEIPAPEIKEKPRPMLQQKPLKPSPSSLRSRLDAPRGSRGGAPNTRGRGREGRGAIAGGRPGMTRRKGKQPDMRVKMGDLLEKIQKTHGSG